MSTTTLHPTAGYILDVARGAAPGPLRRGEREYLRDLARQVVEIAAQPAQHAKRELWYRHNALDPARPMVLVFPEDSWAEVIGEDQLEMTDPFWRQQEWYLRHLIYRTARMPDDFVIESAMWVRCHVRWGDWGLTPRYIHAAEAKGSYVWEAPIAQLEDIEKLHYPEIEVDELATQQEVAALGDVFSDLLDIRIHCALPHANLIGEATSLRGIEQVMVDMHDRPAWLHRLMEFLAEGFMRRVCFLADNGYLTLNNGHHYNDSGGIGYTRELPAAGYDPGHVRLVDLWGFGVAQELSGVGPRQHEEFLLNYQLRLLEQCGLNAYGCCEPYSAKFDMLLRRVPRLRRVSVSPWCDLERAANKLEDKVIFSWKPNPAMMVGNFEPDAIRAYIRRTLQVAHGCVLEMIHKDTFTLEREPARLETWCRIAREEIERAAG